MVQDSTYYYVVLSDTYSIYLASTKAAINWYRNDTPIAQLLPLRQNVCTKRAKYVHMYYCSLQVNSHG